MTPLFLALLLSPAAAPETTIERDVVYATVGKEKLTMDILRPKTPGPHPVVVGFHGGAWKYGNKRDLSRPTMDLLDFTGAGPKSQLDGFAEKGYVAVSVGYRFAPEYKFPAQIEDAKTAIRFLRANAKKYDIDPEHVGAFGFSSGGHIVAMLDVTNKEDGFDGPLYPEQSSKVNCVVDFFGPTDLVLYTEASGIESAYMVPLLGTRYAKDPELYKKASPLYHVSKDAAPILILHGTLDVIVPIIHSERFYNKLVEAKVPAKIITVRGKGHGWSGEKAQETRDEAIKFFDEYLKGKK